MEGKDTEAQRVVDEDMRITMAIEPNKRPLDTLQLEADNLSKMRTARLDYYLRHGGEGATAAAEELFHTLVEHKLATLYQFSAMMNFCHDSNGMWNIMNVTMPNAGVPVSIEHWMQFSVRLSIEGDTKRKEQVTNIINEMAKKEKHTFHVVDSRSISDLRSEKLMYLLEQRTGGSRSCRRIVSSFASTSESPRWCRGCRGCRG